MAWCKYTFLDSEIKTAQRASQHFHIHTLMAEAAMQGARNNLRFSCCIQGLHPSRDPAFQSFGETLLISSAVVKCDGISWFRHQMFYPYVTISAAQARESDDLRYATSPFSLFLSFFFGACKEFWDM